MKGRSGEREEDSENVRRGRGEGESKREREREIERARRDGSQNEEMRESARRKTPRRSRQRKKEGERSGSPALLALRWLKAKESARPRTRPGRDLLPSSFLHPALSPRHARRSLASHPTPVSPLRSPSVAPRAVGLCLSVSVSLSFRDTQTIASRTRRCYFPKLITCGRPTRAPRDVRHKEATRVPLEGRRGGQGTMSVGGRGNDNKNIMFHII